MQKHPSKHQKQRGRRGLEVARAHSAWAAGFESRLFFNFYGKLRSKSHATDIAEAEDARKAEA